MSNKLFVANIPYELNGDTLAAAFAPFGTVVESHIVNDKDTGQSRGFGFVEMASDEDADNAISGLNGQNHEGRKLRVERAKEKQRRGPESPGPHKGRRGRR